MSNGFKILQTVNNATPKFVAKQLAGNDSNSGDLPESPKASIVENADNIIGSGIYSFGGRLLDAESDGVVIINATSDINSNNSGYRRNLRLNMNGFAIAFSGGGVPINEGFIIKNCALRVYGTNIKCKIIDTNNRVTFSQTADKNIIINSEVRFVLGYKNGYIDASSTALIANTNYSPSNIDRNNINGVLIFDALLFSDSQQRSYAIKDQLTGTPQDNGYNIGVNWLTEAQLTSDGYTGPIAGWDAAVATCINRDPKFNNVALEDFSLQADSPHIGRASDGGNIGGTEIANTVLVNQNGVGTIEINAQPEIDTTNPNFYTVATNEDEGYIDIMQRIGTQPIVLTEIEPISTLEFDSDIAGGSVGNQNVPDSEPQTAEYPRKLTTTSLAPDALTLNVVGHDVVVGEFVRVLGEDREVTAVTTDTITVGTAFRAAVASGVEFQVGSEVQLAALRPNRLTYQLRVSTQATKPMTDAEWDNNIDPIYNYAGLFSTQEWYAKPGYVIDNGNVYGSGDAEANPAITPDEIAATWINVRVWLRNNYSS